MKVIPFQIPKNTEEAFRVQVDDGPHLYNQLHQHPEIQLMFIIESHGTLIAGDYMGRFHPGDLYVIGSNQPHVFRNDEVFFRGKLRALSISIYFDMFTLGPSFWQLPEMKTVCMGLRGSAWGQRIRGKKRKVIEEILIKLTKSEGISKLILFMEVLKQFETKKEMTPLSMTITPSNIKIYDGDRLSKIIEFTFKEYHRRISLTEVATLANLTPEAFCNYFKTRTRKTYINFLNEMRINQACRLLSEDKTIADVCYECGFSNLSNFNRVFKKVKKVSPAQFRNKLYKK